MNILRGSVKVLKNHKLSNRIQAHRYHDFTHTYIVCYRRLATLPENLYFCANRKNIFTRSLLKAGPQPLQRPFSVESSLLNNTSQRHFRRSSSIEPEAGDELDNLEDYQEFGDFNDDISISLREMIRKRGGRVPSRKAVSARELLVVRKKIVNGEAEEAGAPTLSDHKKIFDDECKQIESRLATLPSLDALVDQYCALKYSSLEQALSSSSNRNSQLARELRELETALKIATVECKISVCANSFYELVREIDEFIKPRYSARQNINRLIQQAIDVEKQYSFLQTIFRQYSQHMNLIVQDLDSLRRDSRVIPSARRIVYRQFKESILKSTVELSRSAHIFRTCYLLRKHCDGPFAAAWNSRLLAVYGPVSNHDQVRSKTLRRSVEALITTGRPSKRRGLNTIALKKPWSYLSLMFRFYQPRKGRKFGPRSPKLDIFWRQLDVLAPFELNWLMTATLSLEIDFLITSLRTYSPGSWSKLDPQSHWQHYMTLKESLYLFDDLRAQISYHCGSLRAINWLRLQSENKLHALGVQDSTRHRGLFNPPNPLSQSISTFTNWAHSMASNISMSKHLRVKVEELSFGSRTQTEHRTTDNQTTPKDLRNFEARQIHSAVLDPLHFQPEYSFEPFQDALSISNAPHQREELPHVLQRPIEWHSRKELTPAFPITGLAQNTKLAKDVSLLETSYTSQAAPLNGCSEHSDSQTLSILKSDVVSAAPQTPRKSSKKNPRSQRPKNPKPSNIDAEKKSKRFAGGEKPDQAPSNSKVLESDVVSALRKSSKRLSKIPRSQRQENPKPFNIDAKNKSKRFAGGEKPDPAPSNPKLRIKGVMGSKIDQTYNHVTNDDLNSMENNKKFTKTHDIKLRPRKTTSNDHYNKPSFTKRSIAGCFTSAKSVPFSGRYKPSSVRRYRSSCIALAGKEADERSENVLPPISRSPSESNSGSSCLQEFPLDTGGSLSLDDSKSICSTVESSSMSTPMLSPLCNRDRSQPEPRFWSHNLYKGPDDRNILVHYCRSLERTERVANYFLKSDVVGFDIEWKILPVPTSDIQINVSLIQLANEERIALFHIAAFAPGKTLNHLVSPSLKKLLESPNVTKAGVSIKADCTRLRKYLDIDTRGLFELSHLYRLVKYCQSDPKQVNKRLVNLSLQVEEHFGLPMDKHDDVRCSDWTGVLGYHQVQYAAADPYACFRLYHAMEEKRQSLNPVPPRPAHAELNLPIRLTGEVAVAAENAFEGRDPS
ncbi:hypothetical protein V8E54_006792 [Elaphomyces granulatus]